MTDFSPIPRLFTKEGADVYADAHLEMRDARIVNAMTGEVAFEQTGVEVPAAWSMNATNILAQKYFRGVLGSSEREHSLREVTERIVNTITAWGRKDGYFDESEAEAFADELRHIILHQYAAFNSPVWFNIGVPGVPQQASACFILSVEDSMNSILNWYREEGLIFKGGSGSGVNLSRLRASVEQLTGGGTASGPVSFMRGADASAGTIKSGGKTRRAAKMVILDADHPDVEDFIWCKAREERKARVLADAGFDMGVDGKDAPSIQYQNANNSVRLSDEFMEAALAGKDWNLLGRSGGVVRSLPAAELLHQIAEAAWECADPGVQFSTTINRWHTAPAAGSINGSNPCSEYLHLDNSACNLSSLNLMKFLRADGSFDVRTFTHVATIMFTAMDILVGNSDYPTPGIGENARKYRELGIGYANLGALLMALGTGYDSDAGRAWAGAITALLTGTAYRRSAVMAKMLSPWEGYDEPRNREAMLAVLNNHRAAVAGIDASHLPSELLAAVTEAWEQACELAETHGVRNSQASVMAPTGTIGFVMDCDTTGVEPDLGLVKSKKLVGGGTMQIVNQTIPRALATLGYTPDQVDEIIAHISAAQTIVGAPHVDPAHYEVFATSMGDPTISYMGHVRMLASIQPFVSGGISKTVNLPEEATVEDIEKLFVEAWQMGVKAVAIYRNGSKVGQPLTIKSEQKTKAEAPVAIFEPVSAPRAARRKLPRSRRSTTFAFQVADAEGYVTVGEYEDGSPGEVFIKVSKQGSTLAGIMDAFSISVSLGLQYGVPLETFVRKYTNMRFDPAGMTDDPDLRIASSLVDYIFRRLAIDYLAIDERADLGIFTTDERKQPELFAVGEGEGEGYGAGGYASAATSEPEATVTPEPRSGEGTRLKLVSSNSADAPYCYMCGQVMQRSGACFTCRSCGASSGCS